MDIETDPPTAKAGLRRGSRTESLDTVELVWITGRTSPVGSAKAQP
jgi:hypothetical protein